MLPSIPAALAPAMNSMRAARAGQTAWRALWVLLTLTLLLGSGARARASDELPQPPGLAPGDAASGRAIVADRQTGLCLLCHSGPFPEVRQQGTLAPALDGAGSRYSIGQLRMRIAEARRINPDSLMPSYRAVDAADRVGPQWRGRPLLSDQQIEHVVAYLATLR